MEIKFIDWEIEKYDMEEFNGYDFRFQLEEIMSREGNKVTAKNLYSSNDIDDILKRIGVLMIYGKSSDLILSKDSSNFAWNYA